MIKKTLLILIVAILAFAAYVAFLPGQYSVERSATIAASPEAVFAHVNNFKKWEDWSPWAKRGSQSENSIRGSRRRQGIDLQMGRQRRCGQRQNEYR